MNEENDDIDEYKLAKIEKVMHKVFKLFMKYELSGADIMSLCLAIAVATEFMYMQHDLEKVK